MLILTQVLIGTLWSVRDLYQEIIPLKLFWVFYVDILQLFLQMGRYSNVRLNPLSIGEAL